VGIAVGSSVGALVWRTQRRASSLSIIKSFRHWQKAAPVILPTTQWEERGSQIAAWSSVQCIAWDFHASVCMTAFRSFVCQACS
jgi:hypothetical protein